MFKSGSVIEHIFRGVLGFGLLGVGLLYSAVLGWWTLVPLAGALVCFRGCPMCWTAGLVETVLQRKSQKGCIDGSCGPDLRSLFRQLRPPVQHVDTGGGTLPRGYGHQEGNCCRTDGDGLVVGHPVDLNGQLEECMG